MNSLAHIQEHLHDWLLRRTATSAVRRVGDLPISIGTDIGTARSENQDRVAVLRFQDRQGNSRLIVALSDGIGGLDDGAACASLTIAAFFTYCMQSSYSSPHAELHSAARYANDIIYRKYNGHGGATLSAILIASNNPPLGVNIGDSRIYSYEKGTLVQLSTDDTLNAHTPNVPGHDQHHRNQLLQFIGLGSDLEPHILQFTAQQATLYLTTDGIHGVNHNILSRIIENAPDTAQSIKRLLELSKWAGGKDNATGAAISSQNPQSFLWQHPAAVQVYDPFGEVRIILAPTAHRSDSPDRTPSAQQTEKTAARPRKARNRGTKPPRKSVEQKNSLQPNGERGVGEIPQLDIEFGNSPENGHEPT